MASDTKDDQTQDDTNGKTGGGNQESKDIATKSNASGVESSLTKMTIDAWLHHIGFDRLKDKFNIFEYGIDILQLSKDEFGEFLMSKCDVEKFSHDLIAFYKEYDKMKEAKGGNAVKFEEESKDELVARLFRIDDAPGTKTKIHAIAAQRYLAGYIKRSFDSEPWNCVNCGQLIENSSVCGGCYETNPNIHTFTEVRLEGPRKNVNLAVGDIQKWLKCDLSTCEVATANEPLCGYLTIHATPELIKRRVSSDQNGKKSNSVRSQESNSDQWGMKKALFRRDGGICRLHGKECTFTTLFTIDTFRVGHLSSVKNAEERIDFIHKNDLTFDVRNGYLWCDAAEWAFTKDLFCIDPETGNAIFAPEFPFEDLKIDEKKVYKIGKFEEEENKDELFSREPPRSVIKARYDIYLKKRGAKLDKYNLLGLSDKLECEKCGMRFKNKSSLDNHVNQHKNSNAEIGFKQRHYYVTKI